MNHKIFKSIIIILASLQHSFAQQPEKIESIVKVPKPNNFYLEQMSLWKKEIDKNPKNANAWFNFYQANRYAQISQENDSINIPQRFARLEKIVKDIEKNIPNTFEANYIKWANGYNNESLYPYLQKAYEMDSNRIETYSHLINHYEMQRDVMKRDYFLKKWYESGEGSPGLLSYNYNALISLKPNSILITGGDNDTYFAWMLQAVFGIRKDVIVINTALLTLNKDYAQKLSKELKAPINWEEEESYAGYANSFLKRLAENKSNRPLSVAVTAYGDFTKPFEDKLFLTGLMYEYSDVKIDNVAMLKKNLEKDYALDYLKVSFAQDPYQSIVPIMNSSYIVPMLTLYNHYKLSGELERANYWRAYVELVAKKYGNEKALNEYFKD